MEKLLLVNRKEPFKFIYQFEAQKNFSVKLLNTMIYFQKR